MCSLKQDLAPNFFLAPWVWVAPHKEGLVSDWVSLPY